MLSAIALRCALVCTSTFDSSWGCCPKTPVLPRAVPATPPAGARPGALRSRTPGWLRLDCPPPHTPAFHCARLIFKRLATAVNELFGMSGLPPPHPLFRYARLLSCRRRLADGSLLRATKRLAGGGCLPHLCFPLRSACIADGSLPRSTRRLVCPGCRLYAPVFRYARLLSCRRRLADGSLLRATKQAGAAPPRLRFPLRSACIADGLLPRATKRLAGWGCRP
jgi:hypothetical protein